MADMDPLSRLYDEARAEGGQLVVYAGGDAPARARISRLERAMRKDGFQPCPMLPRRRPRPIETPPLVTIYWACLPGAHLPDVKGDRRKRIALATEQAGTV